MRALTVWIALLTACGPAEGVLLAPSELDSAVTDSDTDTGGPGDTDPDPDTSDTSDSSDTSDTSDTPPDTSSGTPESWEGERTFVFTWNGQPACTDSVTETGNEVSDDPAFSDAIAACPACDLVYRIAVEPGEICRGQLWGNQAIPVSREALRGVKYLNNREVRVYDIRRDWSGDWQSAELARGEGDRTAIAYDYEVSQSGLQGEVTGAVRLR